MHLQFCIFVLLQIYFYFLIFEKFYSKIGELSSRKLHSGTFHCPGTDLTGTRDISFDSETVPGHPYLVVDGQTSSVQDNALDLTSSSSSLSMMMMPVGVQCPISSSLGEFPSYWDLLWCPGLSPVLVSIALPFAFHT